jgi:hypothetical protein
MELVTFLSLQAGLHLLNLYRDLQKFEAILEEVAQGDGNSLAVKHMMVSTRKFLRQVQ